MTPKDNFTKVQNKAIEAIIKTRLSGIEVGYVLLIWRLTWGWGREEASIPLSVFSKSTNTTASNAAKYLRKIEECKVIKKTRSLLGNRYSFNSDFSEWSGRATITNSIQNDTVNLDTVDFDTVDFDTVEINRETTVNLDTVTTVNLDTVDHQTTLDSMRPTESLKKVKEKKERKEGEPTRQNSFLEKDHGSNQIVSPALKTSVSDYSDRALLAKALGKLDVSESELMLWQALKGISCTLSDVEVARKAKNKNNMAFLKDIICEVKDARIRLENDPLKGCAY